MTTHCKFYFHDHTATCSPTTDHLCSASKMHFQIHFDICCCSTNLNPFCNISPLFSMSEEQKLCRLSHFSNLQFLFDEMTCGTEWNWDFPGKILQTSQRQFWMNKIYSDNGLSGLDRIFDIWHQVTGSIPSLATGTSGPFSADFIEWWEKGSWLRLLGILEADRVQLAAWRRAKHFVNSPTQSSDDTRIFCQKTTKGFRGILIP